MCQHQLAHSKQAINSFCPTIEVNTTLNVKIIQKNVRKGHTFSVLVHLRRMSTMFMCRESFCHFIENREKDRERVREEK